MRSAGMEDEEIGKLLGIGKRTVSDYVHKAGKNGWLEALIDDPKDKLEYSILHKVVRNIDELIEGRDKETTLEVFKQTLGKRFAEAAPVEANKGNQLTVNIVMPNGGPAEIREGTTGGTPAYIDVEPIKE